MIYSAAAPFAATDYQVLSKKLFSFELLLLGGRYDCVIQHFKTNRASLE